MNNNISESKDLIEGLKEALKSITTDARVIVSPTYVNLTTALNSAKDSVIEVAAQNMHQAKSGAYTGEISGEMLTSIGIQSVILGHSERRTYFGEDDAQLTEKVNAALENGLEAIFCFGELFCKMRRK